MPFCEENLLEFMAWQFQLIIGELFISSEIIYFFVLDLLVPMLEIEKKI